MYAYRAPGVYFEWLPRRLPAGTRRTDIAGFVGIAERGPLNDPVKVESWEQFVGTFGGHVPQGFLAYAVEGFFANAGRTCWVVRVADPEAARKARAILRVDEKNEFLIEASSPGAWGNGARVTAIRRTLRHGRQPEEREFRYTLITELPSGQQEIRHGVDLSKLAAGPPPNEETPSIDTDLISVKVLPDKIGLLGLEIGDLEQKRRASMVLAGGTEGLARSLTLRDAAGDPTLYLYAAPAVPAAVIQKITVGILTVEDQPAPGDRRFSLHIRVRDAEPAAENQGSFAGEVWTGLTMQPKDPAYVATRLNHPRDGSRLIQLRDLAAPTAYPDNTPRATIGGPEEIGAPLAGGLAPAHLSGPLGLGALARIDEVAIVAMPDIMPKPPFERVPAPARLRCELPSPTQAASADTSLLRRAPEFPADFLQEEIGELQGALLAHCERLRDRFAILDSRFEDATPSAARQWREGLPPSKFGAYYFPAVLVPDRLGRAGRLVTVPPSGHLAGVYARGDLAVGVHRPPANEVLEGVSDVAVDVDETTYGELNEISVNLIRPYPGRSILVAGARTLSDDPEWRYINVRRLVSMIEEAIAETAHWTVFEPSDLRLWLGIERSVRSLLEGLWRRGMLDGASQDEAFLVRCDATTNPADELAAGRVTCLVQLLPPWPAEYVVLRIGVTQSGVEVLSEGGTTDA